MYHQNSSYFLRIRFKILALTIARDPSPSMQNEDIEITSEKENLHNYLNGVLLMSVIGTEAHSLPELDLRSF